MAALFPADTAPSALLKLTDPEPGAPCPLLACGRVAQPAASSRQSAAKPCIRAVKGRVGITPSSNTTIISKIAPIPMICLQGIIMVAASADAHFRPTVFVTRQCLCTLAHTTLWQSPQPAYLLLLT